jgi:hypothetical protein
LSHDRRKKRWMHHFNGWRKHEVNNKWTTTVKLYMKCADTSN